ncbi:hypothetical protein PG994_013781 [Apiospora phragmitis]|uniref:AB hydrolase-1 domain-containing protein n=1 Tax=Apiospora phragmitis TaxID=2905665 RepID=A0ABR1T4G3_9PEZI
MRFSLCSAVWAFGTLGAAVNPTVVIVPGAWQIDPSWTGFMQKLTSAGYDTKKVTLPSVGISLTGLDTDVAATAAVVDPLLDAGKDVVLLSHSLGGLIAGNAVQGRDYASRKAAGKEGGVIQLIYLAAFMCPEGASLKDLMGGSYFPWMIVADGKVTGDPAQIEEIGFNDMSATDAKRWASAMTWTSEKVFTDASKFSPWAAGITESYIHTELDNALPFAVQQQMQAMLPAGSAVFSINSSHVPFISHPDELLPLVRSAIDAGVAAKKA